MTEDFISKSKLRQNKLELLEKEAEMMKLVANSLSTIKTIVLWWCIISAIALFFLAYAIMTYEPPTEFR